MRIVFIALAVTILFVERQTLRAEETELLLPNGTYRGEVRGGVPHGRGVFVWRSDGGSFQGTWERGLMEGRGVYTSKSGKITEIFYRLGDLAVDYQTLPEGYISTVCQYASEIYAGAVEGYVQLSSNLTVENEVHTVNVSYQYRVNGQLDSGTSVCKFTYNEKHSRFEMINVRMHGIEYAGEKAKDFSKHLEQSLFLPSFLE